MTRPIIVDARRWKPSAVTSPLGPIRTPSQRWTPLHERAFQLIGSQEARAAFDFSKEPEAMKNRYGKNEAGSRMLLARRLVEAGEVLAKCDDATAAHQDAFLSFLAPQSGRYIVRLQEAALRGDDRATY